MRWALMGLALMIGLYFFPLRLSTVIVWREWDLRGEVRLLGGLVRLAAEVGLRSPSFCVTLNGRPLSLKSRKPGQKRRTARSSSGKPSAAKAVLRALRCRKLSVAVDLGFGQDAAATALAYGTLQTLTRMLLAWGDARGARCSGHVQAHFDRPCYEGRLEGIFSTSTAHIISSLNRMRR